MKPILVLLFLCFSGIALAQDRAEVKGDTLYYAGHKFFRDQPLRLGYGSAADKSFAFVWDGAGITLGAPASSGSAKIDTRLLKWYKGSGKYWVQLKVAGSPGKYTIDVEGAVDNKEVLIDTNR